MSDETKRLFIELLTFLASAFCFAMVCVMLWLSYRLIVAEFATDEELEREYVERVESQDGRGV